MENKSQISTILIATLILCFVCSVSFAAIGCELNDPDRDIQKIFPQSTGYKTDYFTIQEKGGEKLKKEVEEKLGDAFDPIYESLDVPYSYYTILKGKDVIGYVHGVNQKGTYGTLQIILATDPDGKIMGFYYQKVSSPEALKFRDKAFTDKFIGLTLEDFYKYGDPNGKIAAIKDPSQKSQEDFKATIRGTKKNLILLDTFLLNKKHEGSYKGVRNDEYK
ncbi:MAG: hypothetical protein NTZ95_04060 [Candidatus Omnitrophica bacterium]|nr:hypothetical protein [Candidatus Omnitrophota bacterium]